MAPGWACGTPHLVLWSAGWHPGGRVALHTWCCGVLGGTRVGVWHSTTLGRVRPDRAESTRRPSRRHRGNGRGDAARIPAHESFGTSIERFTAAQPDGLAVVEIDGVVVGTGCCIAYEQGRFGWIGLVRDGTWPRAPWRYRDGHHEPSDRRARRPWMRCGTRRIGRRGPRLRTNGLRRPRPDHGHGVRRSCNVARRDDS